MTAAPIPTCTEHVDALVAERLRAVLSAVLAEITADTDGYRDIAWQSSDVEIRSVAEVWADGIIDAARSIRRHAAAAGVTLDGE